MTPRQPPDCASMAEVRAEIDRIDAAMVELIAQRFGYVDRAWQLKRAAGTEGAVVPWRIQQVIDRVRAQATSRGLPPDMVDMVGAQWRNMIGWFVQYEEEKLSKALDESANGIASGDAEGLEAPKPAGGA
jgi:isochorismate pyruvate lyase